jgi:hypothetical protein
MIERQELAPEPGVQSSDGLSKLKFVPLHVARTRQRNCAPCDDYSRISGDDEAIQPRSTVASDRRLHRAGRPAPTLTSRKQTCWC